jgi:COMPASS component SWD3
MGLQVFDPFAFLVLICNSTQLRGVRHGHRLHSIPTAHSDPVTSVSYAGDGSLILSSGYDGLCRLWNAVSGQCLKTLVHDDGEPIGAASFSPNALYLATSSLDGCIRMWDYVTGKVVRVYQGHACTQRSLPLAFVSTDLGCTVVSGSEDGRIVGWDSDSELIVLNEKVCDSAWVSGCSVSPDGKLLASSTAPLDVGDGGEIKIFECV